jgi:hypothetical protein
VVKAPALWADVELCGREKAGKQTGRQKENHSAIQQVIENSVT